MPRPGFWWVYVLERADGSWYTGVSTDPRRRLQEHKNGRGAKANKFSPPERLVCLEPLGPYPDALRREAQIKALPKDAKRRYAADPGGLPPPQSRPRPLPTRAKPKKSRKGPKRV